MNTGTMYIACIHRVTELHIIYTYTYTYYNRIGQYYKLHRNLSLTWNWISMIWRSVSDSDETWRYWSLRESSSARLETWNCPCVCVCAKERERESIDVLYLGLTDHQAKKQQPTHTIHTRTHVLLYIHTHTHTHPTLTLIACSACLLIKGEDCFFVLATFSSPADAPP